MVSHINSQRHNVHIQQHIIDDVQCLFSTVLYFVESNNLHFTLQHALTYKEQTGRSHSACFRTFKKHHSWTRDNNTFVRMDGTAESQHSIRCYWPIATSSTYWENLLQSLNSYGKNIDSCVQLWTLSLKCVTEGTNSSMLKHSPQQNSELTSRCSER